MKEKFKQRQFFSCFKINVKIQNISLFNPLYFSAVKKSSAGVKTAEAKPDTFEKKEKSYLDRISEILDRTSADYDLKRNSIRMLNYYLFFDDKRAGAIKKIIKMVEEEKLQPEILVRGSINSNINEDVYDDLERLDSIDYTKEALLSEFVPLYKDENDAHKNTKTGDVVQIENKRNIFIKTKDDKLKELFITPATYLEFFMPIERFASVQSYTGDCYFLASMNALYSNPNSREKILECFNEDKNGLIEMNFSGYERKEGAVVKKDKKRFSIQNVDNSFDHSQNFEYAMGANWIQAFEMLFRKEIEAKAEKTIDERYSKFLSYKEEMGDKPYIEKDGFKYYKDEIELYIKFAEDYFNNPNDKEKRLISFGDMPFSIVQEENGIEVLEESEEDDEFDKYANAVCKRYEDYCKNNNVNEVKIDFIAPMPLAREYSYCFDSDWNDDDPYMDGGMEKTVFEKMNLKAKMFDIKHKNVLKILNSKDFNKKYVATVSADKKSTVYEKGYDISNGHAYVLSTFDDNGETKFKIKNPSNFLYEDVLTYEELKEGFDNITIAEI